MDNGLIKIYANFLNKFLKPAKSLKVVFDCSNGTTGLVLKKLLQTANCKLQTLLINATPDGNFPAHGPNPSKAGAMNQLKKEILSQKADLGIIFDADGDRVFFIDNKGKFINPDIIANLLIWRLNPKKVVIDVRTGWLVRKPTTYNQQLTTSRVGHYYIKKLMRKIKADFGAEQSGHYYFAFQNLGKGELYYDSGILSAIEIINAVSKLPYKLSNYIDLLPQYYRSPELNLKVENPKQFIKKIEKYYKSKTTDYKLLTTNYLDGLTMEFSDWWFNLRPSNTEPLLRLNIESNNKILLQQKIKELKSFIKQI